MSVTFTVAARTPEGSFHGCQAEHTCGDWDCADNLAWGTCDHVDLLAQACAVCSAEVNLSRANAAVVLDRLGLEPVGHLEPADFRGRALLANIGHDDSGFEATVTPGGWAGEGLGPTLIDCGHDAGYFDRVMGRLVALVDVAENLGLQVGWG